MDKNCDNCIHKEVCKFKDTATAQKVEEPFEISCKHYVDKKPILNYPYGSGWKIRGIDAIQTATSICDNCGFYDKTNKKCTIEGQAMGIVGLPCQPKVTCNTIENGIE